VTADPSATVPALSATARPRLAVVDTNVWLDIHFFLDRDCQSVAAALASKGWIAARCEQTDAELAAVLRRPRFSPGPAERSRLHACLHQWQAGARLFAVSGQAPCRCRDPDDQKFLDLAWSAQAAVLLTKDRALLALARQARRFGLAILAPREFARRFAAD
jgi:putative PIN family toxin of toxin-antitoxin system